MGRRREDRLHLRRIEKIGLAAGALIGAALSPDTVSGDAGRMLAIFLGLVSASILPAITLLVNSMSASGRSVQAIDELNSELHSAMDALFLLFGCVGIVVAALVALAMPSPSLFDKVPYLVSEALPRMGQAVVVLASILILFRVGQIPGILRRTLAVRHRIAVDEAKRKTLEAAPDAGSVRSVFATNAEFGKTLNVEDLQARDPH